MNPTKKIISIFTARQTKAISDLGIPVSIGAHGQREGLGAHWDIWTFALGGMSNMEALRTATINPARALGLDRGPGLDRAGQARRPRHPRRQPAREHPQHHQHRYHDARRHACSTPTSTPSPAARRRPAVLVPAARPAALHAGHDDRRAARGLSDASVADAFGGHRPRREVDHEQGAVLAFVHRPAAARRSSRATMSGTVLLWPTISTIAGDAPRPARRARHNRSRGYVGRRSGRSGSPSARRLSRVARACRSTKIATIRSPASRCASRTALACANRGQRRVAPGLLFACGG